jgi:hypothetical protein
MATGVHDADLLDYVFWATQVRGLSSNTVRVRLDFLHRLSEFTGLPLRDLEPGHLLRFERIAIAGRAAESRRAYVCHIRAFYRWAVTTGLVQHDPSEVLTIPAVPRHLPRPIDEDDLAIAIDAARPKMRAMLTLAGWAGPALHRDRRPGLVGLPTRAGRIGVHPRPQRQGPQGTHRRGRADRRARPAGLRAEAARPHIPRPGRAADRPQVGVVVGEPVPAAERDRGHDAPAATPVRHADVPGVPGSADGAGAARARLADDDGDLHAAVSGVGREGGPRAGRSPETGLRAARAPGGVHAGSGLGRRTLRASMARRRR